MSMLERIAKPGLSPLFQLRVTLKGEKDIRNGVSAIAQAAKWTGRKQDSVQSEIE